jgi:EAL domain-containing protein (putative c-di-GMP-specific phosphodiesterase class I)
LSVSTGKRRLGVRLALDDFGTGYSSLNYLRRFPVDTLKIDGSFVRELESDNGSLAIVRAVISLAHALQMDVTAEGFETAAQLARLRDAYCDHGQGYYFAKPLPGEQMNRLLASVA